MPPQRLLIASILALTAASPDLRPTPVLGRQIVVREHLGVAWTRELVTYPFEAPEGGCRRESVAVRGPAGPVACQLGSVVSWPGDPGIIRSAMLSFMVDLAPRSEDTYMITYGPEPESGRGATHLTVTTGRDRVEVTTGLFGAL